METRKIAKEIIHLVLYRSELLGENPLDTDWTFSVRNFVRHLRLENAEELTEQVLREFHGFFKEKSVFNALLSYAGMLKMQGPEPVKQKLLEQCFPEEEVNRVIQKWKEGYQ